MVITSNQKAVSEIIRRLSKANDKGKTDQTMAKGRGTVHPRKIVEKN